MNSKDELITNMRQGYADFTGWLATLTPEQVTMPTDAVGWSVKDHVMHLAVWQAGVAALLNREDRAAGMGIDAATWASRDIEKTNAVSYEQHRYLPWRRVLRHFEDGHRRLLERVEALSWDDLHKPSGQFKPAGHETDEGNPVIELVQGDGFEHFVEHRPWLEAILDNADAPADPHARLLKGMDRAWNYLSGYMATLTDEQASVPQDHVGWTAKDHVMHFALWVGSVVTLLDKQPRHVYMGVDKALWDSGDYETINAALQARTRDLSWGEVQRRVEDSHRRLTERVRAMSWADLQKPYGSYLPAGEETNTGDPVVDRVSGNTYRHYPEHIEWMDAIVSP